MSRIGGRNRDLIFMTEKEYESLLINQAVDYAEIIFYRGLRIVVNDVLVHEDDISLSLIPKPHSCSAEAVWKWRDL